MKLRGILALGALVLTGALFSACGGGSSPSSPTPSPSPSPGSGNVVTITSAGVSPQELTVSPGTRVQFVNNDTSVPNHEMASDPHPDHTTCPEINSVGFIAPGQTKETGNLNTVRTCGYHDHNLPSDTRYQGRIIIR